VLALLEELHDFLTHHPSIAQLCIHKEVSHQNLPLPPSMLPTLETYLFLMLAHDAVPSCPSHIILTWMMHIPEIEIEDVVGTLAKVTFPMCHFSCTTFGTDTNHGIMLTPPIHQPIPHAMPSHPATLVCRPGTHS